MSMLARERVAPHVPRTPLLRHPLLDEATGLSIWVKHENHNPTCAFKVRGGLNLVGAMTADERARGIVTASTGNHGQSIGLASRIHGVPCTVFVPDGNNPEKNAAMRAYGATVEEGGKDFDEARERCEARARRDRRALRAFRRRAVADRRRRHLRARSVRRAAACRRDFRADRRRLRRLRLDHRAQCARLARRRSSASARSMPMRSIDPGRVPSASSATSANTFAEGIATRVSFDLPFSIYKQYLDDFVQLTEEELAAGVRLALKTTHNLAEGAGSAAIAAAYKLTRQPGRAARRLHHVRRQHRRRETEMGARPDACRPD